MHVSPLLTPFLSFHHIIHCMALKFVLFPSPPSCRFSHYVYPNFTRSVLRRCVVPVSRCVVHAPHLCYIPLCLTLDVVGGDFVDARSVSFPHRTALRWATCAFSYLGCNDGLHASARLQEALSRGISFTDLYFSRMQTHQQQNWRQNHPLPTPEPHSPLYCAQGLGVR